MIFTCISPQIYGCPDDHSDVITFTMCDADHLNIENLKAIYAFIRFECFDDKDEKVFQAITVIKCNVEHLKIFYMGQLNFAMEHYNIKKCINKFPSRNIVAKLLFDKLLCFDIKLLYLDATNQDQKPSPHFIGRKICSPFSEPCISRRKRSNLTDEQALELAIKESLKEEENNKERDDFQLHLALYEMDKQSHNINDDYTYIQEPLNPVMKSEANIESKESDNNSKQQNNNNNEIKKDRRSKFLSSEDEDEVIIGNLSKVIMKQTQLSSENEDDDDLLYQWDDSETESEIETESESEDLFDLC